IAEEVGDPEIFPCSFDTASKSALIDVVKDRSTHELALAVGADAIEQARRSFASHCLDVINRLKAAILRHCEKLLVEIGCRKAIVGGDFENADQGTRRAGDTGAAMAVGFRKVANGLAANEVVVELARVDKLDGLRGYALVVDVIGAQKAFAVEGFQAGIIHDIHEVRQDAR